MRVTIHYQATYRYEQAVGLSTHIFRLFPRPELGVKVEKRSFTTAAGADVQYRRDLFDNQTAVCFFPGKLDELPFHLDLDLDLEERNPFHFLLESHALNLPMSYRPDEAAALAPYLVHGAVALPEALRPAAPRPTIEALVGLSRWLHESIAYERREEGDAHAPEETLRRGSAACRDFGVLLAEVLRQHGVAARLASGFLWEEEVEEDKRVAESAPHAWVEAYLPGAGWVGLDPTNGVFCDHHFITTAIGIQPSQVATIQGCYYSNQTVGHTLENKLTIQPK